MILQPTNPSLKAGSITAQLVWDGRFSQRYSRNLDNAQKYVDSSCIRHMDRYTPMVTGKLKESVILGTKIGSGELIYNSPAARYLYYGKLMVSSKTGSAYALRGEKKVLTDVNLKYNKASHPDASSFWFEKMKSQYLKDIQQGAERIMMGGRPKR